MKATWWLGSSALLMLSLGLGAIALAATVEVPASRDNTLIEDAAGAVSNGAGTSLFVGNSNLNLRRRAVLFFDIQAHVPADARIQSAGLRLNMNQAPEPSLTPISVHRLLINWGEGTSVSGGGQGAPSTPDDATWLHRFFPDSLWNSEGGDFESNPSATISVDDLGLHIWSGPGLVNDVQLWVSHSAENFGWLLKGDESALGTARRFDSREQETEENRPVLVIEFTRPGVPVQPTTWGRIKEMYGGR